eukprot:365355-Chlamydomonas_euryale.AAC.8
MRARAALAAPGSHHMHTQHTQHSQHLAHTTRTRSTHSMHTQHKQHTPHTHTHTHTAGGPCRLRPHPSVLSLFPTMALNFSAVRGCTFFMTRSRCSLQQASTHAHREREYNVDTVWIWCGYSVEKLWRSVERARGSVALSHLSARTHSRCDGVMVLHLPA